jgi:gamma-glutamyltranspeptidase/glutathione hydrolase
MTMLHHATHCNRRAFLGVAGGAIAGLAARHAFAGRRRRAAGLVVCRREAAEAGMQLLASGGNAVDAAVAAALVGCVVKVSKCGIGGYGGHMMIALPDGTATAIDFNSAAPAAARPDMFPLNNDGSVAGNINEFGWLAAGVPGTLAGMQLALGKYGTAPWRRILQPAIRWARDGCRLPMTYTFWRAPAPPGRPRDAAFSRLFTRHGKPLKKGEIHRNPALADMLQELADSGSAEPFYRGPIGRRIAEAFAKNGGIVTADDLASYQAMEVAPLELEWRGYRIATAPLTAGGLTVLQAMAALKALGWADSFANAAASRSGNSAAATQAWLEALRIAWGDRLALLGDPRHVEVPVERLLSESYAQQSAKKIAAAVADGRPVPVADGGRTADGTLHVAAVDADGMMASLTLTHGNSFGAQVAVDELGLILGHGMSRFEPAPGRPNSIAPGKRPLHNMCPTIVFRGGRPVLALGAAGGRRIPNAIFQVLLGYIGEGRSLEESVRMPRLHTEGGLNVYAEATATAAHIEHLKRIGYQIEKPMQSTVSSVEHDAARGSGPTAIGISDNVPEDGSLMGIRKPQPIVTRGG